MAERLKKSVLYTYGIADMFFIMLINTEMFYFAAFLTDYVQFSMTIVGTILWITGTVDIVCALVAGIILQRSSLKLGGKYRSWFLIGPAIFAPLYLLQFSKIGGEISAACVIVIGFLTSHLLWNVVFTASGAMVGKLSQLPAEITVLSTNRAQGMSAGGLIFSATGLPMIMFFGAHTNKVAGFTLAILGYGILTVLGYWYVYKITAGKDPYDEPAIESFGNEAGQSLKNIVGLVFRNPPLLFLAIAETFRNTGIAIVTAFAFYYFSYVLKNLAFMSVFLLATSIANVIGAFAATWVGIRFGKRNSYWIFLVLAAAAYAATKLMGGTGWGFTISLCIAAFFTMIASSMSTALFSDTVTYGEWKTGKSIRAFTMALANIPIKVGILIRSGAVLLGLAAIGFVSNATPSPSVIDGIISIMTLTPAAACILAAVTFYFGYKIEDRHVLQMQEEIAVRIALESVRC
jgi:glucuronide carrier protein